MAHEWRRIGFGVPHVQDVGATVHDEDPFDSILEPTWFVGSDGSLWFLKVPFEQCQQVPSPGDLTRVAVSPDASKWCADSRGTLWRMENGSWSTIDTLGDKVKDVGVSADRTVWLVMTNGRYYSISPGGTPFFHGVFIVLDGMIGIARPDDANPFGIGWGVSPTFGDSVLCRCATTNGWSPTNIQNVRDLSISEAGIVWMSKADGSIWTTTDGITQLTTGGNAFTRVAGGISGLAWAVAADGTAWVWQETSVPTPNTPPPPPPLPPPGQGPPPSISVDSYGGALDTVFRLTGSGFLPNVQVTIRGARIGDGEIHQFFWSTVSSGSGSVEFDIALPCVPGIVISFSANDGRRDPADHTDRMWSNTFHATCPLG